MLKRQSFLIVIQQNKTKESNLPKAVGEMID